ncbi:MAG TPA: asparagine synthase (glutamine-hydrolyzing) [Puia sp.]|jgi:asparagine synthase (glutamine-hydrolysing)|nr:asparagine synthase (glutamine-hydrolyzing) [Puia sp.]
MCGIAAILDRKNGTIPQELIGKMTNAMSHRGPDADGFFCENEIALGHRRLSIIDLSTAANQPFFDNSGRYVLVFNGEIYNYAEIRPLINDYEFHTNGDSEVLLAAYIKWGPGCLSYLRGMFAFCIWDKKEKQLFMARDRMGVKPLYYYLDDEKLLIASEIRAILATDLVPRKLSEPALLEYFAYQSVSFPFSIIDGIRQLEAGAWMSVRNDSVEVQRYWEVDRPPVSDHDDPVRVKRRIKELLLQSVKRRLVSDVPVGAFLSGGIDSSAVVGLMAEISAAPNTFTISFEEKEYDESVYAEMVSRKFNTNHTRILLRPTVFLDELENSLDAMDTPSGDGVNTYVVSKTIRQHGMTVALSGVGGDELFAGYPFFNQYLQLHGKKALWKSPALLRKALAAVMAPGNAHGGKGKIRQLLTADSWFIDRSYPVFRQILSPALFRQLTRLPAGDTAVARELSARKSTLSGLPLLSQVSAAEFLGYTQHTLLKDTDQMSMAVSLEVREPFFDQDLVEFVLSVPDTQKTPVYPKSLLVESLKPLLPDEIVFRKKQGFTFPWEVWMKKELRTFCDRRIRNMAQRPFIREEKLLSFWQAFLDGDAHIRWPEIWLFVVLEYWLEKNRVS